MIRVAEGADRLTVVGHPVVVEVPAQDAGQPASLVGDGQIAPPDQLDLDLAELGAKSFRVGGPLELEPPVPCRRARVREPEELKPAPRGAMRKEMTDINISSVPAGMPALG